MAFSGLRNHRKVVSGRLDGEGCGGRRAGGWMEEEEEREMG